jgi:hypothetical protein
MLHSSLGVTPCKAEENYLFHSFLSYLESIIGKRERKKKTLDKPTDSLPMFYVLLVVEVGH